MFARPFVAGLLVLAGLAVANPAPLRAATLEEKHQAQTLADQALDCLHRGEDLTDPGQKRATYEQGLAFASRAVALDDENSDAHFAVFGNRGRILLLDGVTPNPISLWQVDHDLERALQLNPNHADALAAKGGLYRQLPWMLGGSLSVAETCLTKAIAIDPDAVAARIELAQTYRDMGYPERGLPLLQTAASIAERQGKARELHEARDLLHKLQQQ